MYVYAHVCVRVCVCVREKVCESADIEPDKRESKTKGNDSERARDRISVCLVLVGLSLPSSL